MYFFETIIIAFSPHKWLNCLKFVNILASRSIAANATMRIFEAQGLYSQHLLLRNLQMGPISCYNVTLQHVWKDLPDR
jgi:hypothetical protein